MRYSLFVFSLLSFISTYAQTALKFENRKIYLGEIEINNAYSINFNYENVSDKPILLGYEPITNLVNATYKKEAIMPKEKGSLKINFYPEQEGPFNEQIYIIVNEKEKIELSVYGSVSSISKSYKSLQESNKLFGDRDIAFMVVDAQTYVGIPYAKVFIKNVENNKSYIGIANRFGVLLNRIPEGKYHIQALVKDYGKEVLDIKLDANRNIAMILLDKPELQDTANKKEKHIAKANPLLDSTPRLAITDTALHTVEAKPVNTKAPYYDPNPHHTSSASAAPAPRPSLSSAENPTPERKALNLILLIDVSKSMEKPNRMGVLKKSLVHLVKNYQDKDYMAILTFNESVDELMERSQGFDREKCIAKINSILPSGNTDGVLGLDKAFDILKSNFVKDAINMVIIATDGKMNKYAFDDKSMLENIEKMNESGLITSVVGFGTSHSQKTKLQQMAESGGGVYIDMNIDTQNLETILLDDIYSTLLEVK